MSSHLVFDYSGPLESSKSIVNRALILQAIHPTLKINYQSDAKDIQDLEKALEAIKQRKSDSTLSLDVGSGGTTFRFLSLYLSKFLGTWTFKMSPQLAKRPKQDLVEILNQLGTAVIEWPPMDQQTLSDAQSTESSVKDQRTDRESRISDDLTFKMRSQFWTTDQVEVDFLRSSQFFSGIALAASDSKQKFTIKCLNRKLGSGYEEITLELLRSLGIKVEDKLEEVVIQKTAEIKRDSKINVGADWSSIIYLISFCFSGSKVKITNADFKSFEPDKQGLNFLKDLGLKFKIDEGDEFSTLVATPSTLSDSKSILDLKRNPDLFPVITGLLSQLALKEKSTLSLKFPEQLKYKESNRLDAMLTVLATMGFQTSVERDLLTLSPTQKAAQIRSNESLKLDANADHRLIMSFELLKSFGYKINYKDAEEVQKSFANFFEILNGTVR